MSVTICSSDSPGTDKSGLYTMPYNEAVSGYRHAYRDGRKGVRWTRKATHPHDPRCPECACNAQKRARS